MKILIVTSKYLPAVGGLETAVQNIATRFKKQGHQVAIITNRYSIKLKPQEMIDEINVRRYFFTYRGPRSANPWIWFKYGIRLCLIPWSWLQLIVRIKIEKPDMVHFHFLGSPAIYLLFAKKILKFPLVVSLHGSDVEPLEHESVRKKKLFKKVFLESDYVTANARHLLQEALTHCNLKDNPQRMAVVPMAFSCDAYGGAKPHQQGGYLFAAGRFVHKKGFDVLIRAFAKLVEEEAYSGDLILAGDGEERKECERLAKQLRIEKRIQFLGTLERQPMASYMKGCDLFVMPSRMEAFGITLLEALYAGKKVVASKVGGLIELMENNPNYLVETDNPDALAMKIFEVLNGLPWHFIDKEELKAKFNWDNTAKSYLSIYQNLIHQRPCHSHK